MNVRLSAYQPDWPDQFESEKFFLVDLLRPWLTGSVEHVGSTAVPGLKAKPIIDIMAGVQTLDASRDAIAVLQRNGYCYHPYKEHVMHWFCKPDPEYRTHHLHLVPYRSRLWRERILFRDILRRDAAVAARYERLKTQLAADLTGDREAYTQSKWPFVRSVLHDFGLQSAAQEPVSHKEI